MSETPRDPYADGYEGDGVDEAPAPSTPETPRAAADE